MNIDLLSTRPGLAAEARGCARLLAAVIVQAIADASVPCSQEERRLYRNVDPQARTALLWLMRSPTLAVYCHLIGLDVDHLRHELFGHRELHKIPGHRGDHRSLTVPGLRHLRARHEIELSLSRTGKSRP